MAVAWLVRPAGTRLNPGRSNHRLEQKERKHFLYSSHRRQYIMNDYKQEPDSNRVTYDLVTQVIHSLWFQWLESESFSSHCVIWIGIMNSSHFHWARVIFSFENRWLESWLVTNLDSDWLHRNRSDVMNLLVECLPASVFNTTLHFKLWQVQ